MHQRTFTARATVLEVNEFCRVRVGLVRDLFMTQPIETIIELHATFQRKINGARNQAVRRICGAIELIPSERRGSCRGDGDLR